MGRAKWGWVLMIRKSSQRDFGYKTQLEEGISILIGLGDGIDLV